MTMLSRWDPFSEISRLQGDLNRLWGESRASLNPAVDIFEEDGTIVMKAEVPGLKAEDIHVNVENGVLTLSGERKLENEDEREGYHRIERSYGSFARSFALPKTVDGEAIDASLDAGVLTLRLPKREAAQPKRIEVKNGG